MFDASDSKETLKSHLSYLTPRQAPYYFIIIGVEIFVFRSAHELFEGPWVAAGVFAGVAIAVCLWFALTDPCDTDAETEKDQLRIARIAGITIPLIAMALSMNKIKNEPTLLYFSLGITFLQVLLFLFLVGENPTKERRSVNVPQLLVICSSLVLSIHFTMASLSSKLYVSKLPPDMRIEPGKDYLKKIVEAKAPEAAASDAKQSEPSKEEREKMLDLYKRNQIAQSINDDSSPLPIVPINQISAEYLLGGTKGIGVNVVSIETSRRQSNNLKMLAGFLIASWASVLGRVVFFAR